MLRMLEAQAPAKQTATGTIDTLSSRLNDSTLLEDRRAAILGLRSFAKEYPASVASGSLRGLIACLSKDLEDIDTIKVVLETLLMLFSPNPDSPEASEDITLWLADEFTQRQDNIEVLLQLLEAPDFYPRLYSLNLITAINTARPERTQECVLNAALGASRLASTLDDDRDAIRNAGLILLSDLTLASTDLQKLIAFENTFDRIFAVIKLEGGLMEGSIVIQDCLELLGNLLRYNPSNQSLFRESGCTLKLAELIGEKEQANNGADGDSWPTPQGDKNIWGLLSVVRLFLMRGSAGTPASQAIFVRHGILQRVLNLAFDATLPPPIKAEALNTCADMVRGNPDIQATFAGSQVTIHTPQTPVTSPSVTNGVNGTHVQAFIIDALLDLILRPPNNTLFEVRLAACECLRAYFYGHVRIKSHFLQRAIEGYMAEEDETPNVLSTLIRENPALHKISDPHRIWFAAVIVLHLIWDDTEGKHALMNVAEGDAEQGEEVVTFIQGLAANLVSSLQNNEDERILLAYFMLLSGLLFEDPAAVNDLLSEGSTIQFLMQTAKSNQDRRPVIKGLCVLLLGLSYEYSTKDSPISRRKLQEVLLSGLGRELYIQSLERLRQHPLIREFEIQSANSASASPDYELPAFAYLDETFVEFVKDNFSRLRRSIDRDPGLEVQIASGNEGVNRDILDTLRTEIDEKQSALQQLNTTVIDLESKLNLEQAAHRKTQESTTADLSRIKQVNEALHKNHESEMTQLQRNHDNARQQSEGASSKRIQDLLDQLGRIQKDSVEQAERSKDYFERTVNQLRTQKKDLETRNAELKQLSEARNGEIGTLKSREGRLREEFQSLQAQLNSRQKIIDQHIAKIAATEAAKTKAEATAEDARTKVSLLEKEVVKMQEAGKKSDSQLVAAEKRVADVEKNFKDANESLKAVQKDLAVKSEALSLNEEKVKDQETKSQSDRQKLSESVKKVNELEKQVDESKQKTTDLESKLSESTKKMTDVESKLNESAKRSTDFETKLSESARKTTDLGKQMSESSKKATDLEKKLKESEQKLAEAVKKSDKKPAAKDNDKALQDLQKKLKDTEQKLVEATTKLDKKPATSESDKAKQDLQKKLKDVEQKLADATSKLEKQTASQDSEKASQGKASQDLQKKLKEAEQKLVEATAKLEKQTTSKDTEKAAHDKASQELQKKLKEAEQKIAEATAKLEKQTASKADDKAMLDLQKKLTDAEKTLGDEKENRSSTQTELDDLLLVFSDLEEKHTQNKKRLKALGEDVSDIEEDDEDDDDEADEE